MSDQDWYTQGEGEINQEELQRRVEDLETIPDLDVNEEGFIECPVLPLRDIVLFPHMVSPLAIGRNPTILAVEEAQANHQIMIALPQRDPKMESPGVKDFIPIGVTAAVSELIEMDDSHDIIIAQGRHRIEITSFLSDGPVLYARGKIIVENFSVDARHEALVRNLLNLFDNYAQLSQNIPQDALDYLHSIDEPNWFLDMIASSFPIPLPERHKLLTTLEDSERIELVTELLLHEIEVLKIEKDLKYKVEEELDRGNRETYLRERMRVIQNELGEIDPWARELEEVRKNIKKAKLPKEPQETTLKELERLYQLPPMSPEVGVIRSYIEWIIALPWNDKTKDNLDISHAADILESNHYGLEKAKERILEYIAVKSLKPKRSQQPILCFIGPPGTGKTTLGRSISEALNREFVRLSLGGVRDEAEMRGHRRTYIGALPGRILQTMRRAGKTNPLFILDEIDKLGVGYRGDPAAALLEVLDPEQNYSFSDHYLEIAYDLSEVIFITTANSRENIPWALLDRMEIIEFPGYIEEEKVVISRNFLIKRQIESAGLETEELHFTDQAVQRIIRNFTYEAGVRNLEREIGRVCRKIARLKAEGKKRPDRVGANMIEKFLGPPIFNQSEVEFEDEVGVATSLAWTTNGGDILAVEVLLVDGKGNLQITGQIGEVMEESAQAAITYMKSRAKELGLKKGIFEEKDVHIHFPEGAVPKDGPSAGITIATAVISAFTRRKVRRDVGITGEITLRGKVLPIGGVRNKILAAHRAGLKTVILPQKNIKDLVEIPKKVRTELEIVPVSHMDEVLSTALVSQKKAARKSNEVKKLTSKGDQASIQPGA